MIRTVVQIEIDFEGIIEAWNENMVKFLSAARE